MRVYYQVTKGILKNMLANKVRTFLTVLGMVVGISATVVVYSAGEGISALIVGQVQSFGTDIIQVEVKVPSAKKGGSGDSASAQAIAQGVQVTTLTLDDMEALRQLPNIKDAYAGIMGQQAVSYGNEMLKAMIMGVSASYIEIDSSEIAEGRFYLSEEDRSASMVVVLGSDIATKLFPNESALDKMIKIGKSKYRVIGIMKERGAVLGMDFDDFMYLPVRTMQKRMLGIDYVQYQIFQLHDLTKAEDTAESARLIMRDRHQINDPDKDDFRISTMAEMMKILETITGAIQLLLLAIVAISLLVGGVGIMNIMYVLVSERTSEIGLRKAVGADSGDILRQFLIESLIITLLGGLIGILLGIFLSLGVSYLARHYGLDWEFIIPMEAYFVSFGFSAFFGLLFGIYPAKKAADLEPIAALRVE